MFFSLRYKLPSRLSESLVNRRAPTRRAVRSLPSVRPRHHLGRRTTHVIHTARDTSRLQDSRRACRVLPTIGKRDRQSPHGSTVPNTTLIPDFAFTLHKVGHKHRVDRPRISPTFNMA